VGLPPRSAAGPLREYSTLTVPHHCPRLADSSEQEVRLTPNRPVERYGSRRNPRWLPAVLLVAVLAAGTAVAVLGYRNLGSAPIEAEQTAFEVIDDSTVEVSFQVVRDQPERPAVCIIRARSRDGDETGRKEVYVPPGPRSVVEHTVLRTSRRPVTGEVFGCSHDVPEYLEPPTAP
jgi:uncharacterized protein DUF4307